MNRYVFVKRGSGGIKGQRQTRYVASRFHLYYQHIINHRNDVINQMKNGNRENRKEKCGYSQSIDPLSICVLL
jgi:hypothetical protein